jgi:hypothetical protein
LAEYSADPQRAFRRCQAIHGKLVSSKHSWRLRPPTSCPSRRSGSGSARICSDGPWEGLARSCARAIGSARNSVDQCRDEANK